MSFDTFLINQKINKECLFKSCISNTCVNNHNNTLPIIYDNTNPEREKNMILLNSSSIDNNGRTSIKLLNNKFYGAELGGYIKDNDKNNSGLYIKTVNKEEDLNKDILFINPSQIIVNGNMRVNGKILNEEDEDMIEKKIVESTLNNPSFNTTLANQWIGRHVNQEYINGLNISANNSTYSDSISVNKELDNNTLNIPLLQENSDKSLGRITIKENITYDLTNDKLSVKNIEIQNVAIIKNLLSTKDLYINNNLTVNKNLIANKIQCESDILSSKINASNIITTNIESNEINASNLNISNLNISNINASNLSLNNAIISGRLKLEELDCQKYSKISASLIEINGISNKSIFKINNSNLLISNNDKNSIIIDNDNIGFSSEYPKFNIDSSNDINTYTNFFNTGNNYTMFDKDNLNVRSIINASKSSDRNEVLNIIKNIKISKFKYKDDILNKNSDYYYGITSDITNNPSMIPNYDDLIKKKYGIRKNNQIKIFINEVNDGNPLDLSTFRQDNNENKSIISIDTCTCSEKFSTILENCVYVWTKSSLTDFKLKIIKTQNEKTIELEKDEYTKIALIGTIEPEIKYINEKMLNNLYRAATNIIVSEVDTLKTDVNKLSISDITLGSNNFFNATQGCLYLSKEQKKNIVLTAFDSNDTIDFGDVSIKAQQLISTLDSNYSPIIVQSNKMVENLNSEYLNGKSYTELLADFRKEFESGQVSSERNIQKTLYNYIQQNMTMINTFLNGETKLNGSFIATEDYVDNKFKNLINNQRYNTNIDLNKKAEIESPHFTGIPTVPTALLEEYEDSIINTNRISSLKNSNTSEQIVNRKYLHEIFQGNSKINTLGNIKTGKWMADKIQDDRIESSFIWNNKQDSLTFGISNGDAVRIDYNLMEEVPVSDRYVKFSDNGIKAINPNNIKNDIGLGNVDNLSLINWTGSEKIYKLGNITTGKWLATPISNDKLENSKIVLGGVELELGKSIKNPILNLESAMNYKTNKLIGKITNDQLDGKITIDKLEFNSINLGGVAMKLGETLVSPNFNLENAINYKTNNLIGKITNEQLEGNITNDKLEFNYINFGGVSLKLGEFSNTPAFNLINAKNYKTNNLIGKITNEQLEGNITNNKLAGGITNNKLVNSSISLGGIKLELGESSNTPEFNLLNSKNYKTSNLIGKISENQLEGEIGNEKLKFNSVSFGGVSLKLGESLDYPEFNLINSKNYKTSNLIGRITENQLEGNIGNDKLEFNSVTYGGVCLKLGESLELPDFNLANSKNYKTSNLIGKITNHQLEGDIENNKLKFNSVSYGGVSLKLGESIEKPKFDLINSKNYKACNLIGKISYDQLEGNIINEKLKYDSVSYGGVTLKLGESVDYPEFDLINCKNYKTSNLNGLITEGQLEGNIPSEKLKCNSVSYGGVSLKLGESIDSPQFNLINSKNYKTNNLIGKIKNDQLEGEIENEKLKFNTISLGGVSLKLGESIESPEFNLMNCKKYKAYNLDGKINNNQLEGEIENDKLKCNSISLGGVSLKLGESIDYPMLNLKNSKYYKTHNLDGKIKNNQLEGEIENEKLKFNSISLGGVSLKLGESIESPEFNLINSKNYKTSNLIGKIKENQLEGEIGNEKLKFNSISLGGVCLKLGESIDYPMLNLKNCKKYKAYNLDGKIKNNQLEGEIENDKLKCNSISLGGVSLKLGESIDYPEFNLRNCKNYKVYNLDGKIKNDQLEGNISGDKLDKIQNSIVTMKKLSEVSSSNIDFFINSKKLNIAGLTNINNNLIVNGDINSSRFVGIGTNEPKYPLHIIGFNNKTKWFNKNQDLTNNDKNLNISIKTQNDILIGNKIISASDERVKTNIKEIIHSEALTKLRELKCYSYNYIDKKNKGHEKIYGFLPQQVKKILPFACKILESNEYIPNIYKFCFYKDNLLIFNEKHNLNINSNIKLILPSNKEINVPYKIIDLFKLHIDLINISNENKPINDVLYDIDGNKLPYNIFAYGIEINDFHALNKEAIWTITTAALQEVDRNIQTEKIKTNELSFELCHLKDKTKSLELLNSSLTSKLIIIENNYDELLIKLNNSNNVIESNNKKNTQIFEYIKNEILECNENINKLNEKNDIYENKLNKVNELIEIYKTECENNINVTKSEIYEKKDAEILEINNNIENKYISLKSEIDSSIDLINSNLDTTNNKIELQKKNIENQNDLYKKTNLEIYKKINNENDIFEKKYNKLNETCSLLENKQNNLEVNIEHNYENNIKQESKNKIFETNITELSYKIENTNDLLVDFKSKYNNIDSINNKLLETNNDVASNIIYLEKEDKNQVSDLNSNKELNNQYILNEMHNISNNIQNLNLEINITNELNKELKIDNTNLKREIEYLTIKTSKYENKLNNCFLKIDKMDNIIIEKTNQLDNLTEKYSTLKMKNQFFDQNDYNNLEEKYKKLETKFDKLLEKYNNLYEIIN